MFGGRPEDKHEINRRVEIHARDAEIDRARRESGNLSLLQRFRDLFRRNR
jgi:hypothetical protein